MLLDCHEIVHSAAVVVVAPCYCSRLLLVPQNHQLLHRKEIGGASAHKDDNISALDELKSQNVFKGRQIRGSVTKLVACRRTTVELSSLGSIKQTNAQMGHAKPPLPSSPPGHTLSLIMTRNILQLPSLGSVCLSCRLKISRPDPRVPFHQSKRLLTTSPKTLAAYEPPSPHAESAAPIIPATLSANPKKSPIYNHPGSPHLSDKQRTAKLDALNERPKPHRLHIYATKHNCHITLAQHNRDALISVSAGNLGFRKAQRGTYDAAYQLGAFMMGKIQGQGMLNENYPGKGGPIEHLEVVLRDFGPGREAVTKILMGAEGKRVREKVLRVMDSTRLKFGGTRSKKPRRLG